MSFRQVSACPKCGAPIYTPTAWWSILPPPPMYTCNCVPQAKTYTTTSLTDIKI